MTTFYNAVIGIVCLNPDLAKAPIERIDALVFFAGMHNATNPERLRLPAPIKGA
jgi:hypothetical protein